MIKSVVFRRIIAVLLLTIGLGTMLTTTLFYFVARDKFFTAKAHDLQLSAERLAEVVSQYQRGDISASALNNVIYGMKVAETRIYWFDQEQELFHVPKIYFKADTALNEDYGDSEDQKQIFEDIRNLVPDVLLGASVSGIVGRGDRLLLVGVPVVNLENRIISGAVFMSVPIREINAARDTLYVTLFYSMLIVSGLMLVFSFFASRNISKPLYEMRNVADAMSRGDFLVRADEKQPLELGELANSLNFLSNRLSNTISELVVERNRLLLVLNGLSEGIVAIDNDKNLTLFNPAIQRLFEKENQPVYNRTMLIEDESLWADFDLALENNEMISRSYEKDDMQLKVDISPINNEKGEQVGVVGLFQDVTEYERLEQTRRDYVANVSHELRTPISAMRSLAETLADGMVKKPEDVQRYYEHIVQESLILSRLVDDLLELSRLQSGKIAFANENVDLYELIMEMVDRYSPMMNEAQITLHAEVLPDCPKVYANQNRIEQILTILLDNAKKFTPEGGSITIEAKQAKEKILISVTDTGVGIERKELSRVFDRFYKVDQSHSGAGTGLGLSIAQQVLSLMGETISVESQVGKGSTFTFTLSMAKEKESE